MAVADRRTEAARNRLLRRADWRFLLANPWPATAICFAQGLLLDATAAIAREVVVPAMNQAEMCELAVAVNPHQDTLAMAWQALRPGGACYTEWYRPLIDGSTAVRRRLERAGFCDVVCYWPWPLPERQPALFWLPMDAPAAVGHFLSNRPRSASVVRDAGRSLLRLLWQLGCKAQLMVPVCAVARKRGASVPGTAGDQMIDPPGQKLRGQWTTWGLGPVPRHLDAILLTGGQRSINKAVSLVFADQQPAPRLIIKMPRVDESVPALRQEASTLAAVHAGRSGGMPGVPQMLFFEETVKGAVLGETVLVGQPLFTLLHRDNFRALALKVTDWLVNLAGTTAPVPQNDWWERLVEVPLRDFEDAFGQVIDHDLLLVTHRMLASLGDLPLVCEQRDCSPWNVLLSPAGELVILDWESAELHGLPALDLIYFLSYLAFFLDGAMHSRRFQPSYRATLDPTTFTGRIVRECLLRYAAAVGLESTALCPLRLLLWLLHARSEFQRLVADAGDRPAVKALQSSLFVQLWEEEVRHALHGR